MPIGDWLVPVILLRLFRWLFGRGGIFGGGAVRSRHMFGDHFHQCFRSERFAQKSDDIRIRDLLWSKIRSETRHENYGNFFGHGIFEQTAANLIAFQIRQHIIE